MDINKAKHSRNNNSAAPSGNKFEMTQWLSAFVFKVCPQQFTSTNNIRLFTFNNSNLSDHVIYGNIKY